MVHLIVMIQGSSQEIDKAESMFESHGNGWCRIENGVWLVATNVKVIDWRDHIKVEAPNSKFAVMRIAGPWATSGMQELADWLKSANGWF